MNGIKLDANSNYICTAYKICTYVRSYYFDSNIAEELGDVISSIGFLFVEVYPNENSKPEVYEISVPVSLKIKYSETSKVTRAFNADDEPEEFMVYTVYKDNIFIENATHVSSPKALNIFLNFLISGKLPENLKYSQLPSIINECMKFNNASLGITNFILELVVSELARSKKDYNTPYRFIAGKTGDELSYHTIKIGEIPKMTSVFSGIAFEDINSALAAAVTTSKLNKKNRIPPTEEMLYY